MEIETPEGEKELVAETLEEYGLVVVKKKEPEELLESKIHVSELKQKLRLAAVETQHKQELLEIERDPKKVLQEQVDGLFSLVGQKLLQTQY